MPASYYYRSPVGTFWIRPRPRDGRFLLGIGDEALGSYHSARAAADDVYVGSTGHYAWDCRVNPNAPTDISEWERRQG